MVCFNETFFLFGLDSRTMSHEIERPWQLESEELIVRNEHAEWVVSAPPVAAIGYIPQITLGYLSEDSAWRHHRFARSRRKPLPAAFEAMFAVGNPTPEDVSNPAAQDLASVERALWFAGTRNFRALMLIDSLKIGFSKSGDVTTVNFDALRKVGYTRVPIMQAGPLPPWVHFDAGEGSTSFELSQIDGQTRFAIWMRYRVGERGDSVGKFLSGKLAPFPLIQIEYLLNHSGITSIRFLGSSIPSVSMYVRWKHIARHDMLKITGDKIDGFLDAEHADAPDETLATWTPDE